MSSLETDKGGVNRYTVKCETHGLHFNPERTAGCVLCAREARLGAAGKSVRAVFLALAAAGLLVGGFRLMGSGVERAATSPSPLRAGLDVFAAGSEGSVASPRLDPERHREVIEKIESALYQRSAPTLQELRTAALAGRDLSDRLQREENPVGAGRTALKLLVWSSRASEVGAGFSPPDADRTRAQWEEIRDGSFKRADWFRSRGGGPVAGPTRPEVDPNLARALSDVAADVFHLVGTGKPESDAIAQIQDAAGPESAQVLRRWRRWRDDWNRRLSRTASKMPPAPDPSGDVNLVLAHQRISAALHYLNLVPMTVHASGVPMSYEREKRFQIALSEAEEGERRLRAVAWE